MKTFAAFATTAGACAFVAIVTVAEPASAAGKTIGWANGPVLDGQKAALPGRTADREITLPDASDDGDLAILANNGPALDGQRIALPDTPLHARR